MVKVKVRTGRGTGIIEVDIQDISFSGEEYKQIQKLRKEKSGNALVSTGRGTGVRKLKDTPEPTSTDTPGTIINRGTKKI